MNIHIRDEDGITIEEALAAAADDLDNDLVGFWLIVSSGRDGFGLTGPDLREFVTLYVFALLSHNALVIEPANDGVHYWQRAGRYGTKPDDIAYAVVAEWIGQGSPDVAAWEGLAFALPEWIDRPDNLRRP